MKNKDFTDLPENNPFDPKECEEEKDYIPFGDEWKKGIKKLPKDFIIDMLKKALMENIELKENATKE